MSHTKKVQLLPFDQHTLLPSINAEKLDNPDIAHTFAQLAGHNREAREAKVAILTDWLSEYFLSEHVAITDKVDAFSAHPWTEAAICITKALSDLHDASKTRATDLHSAHVNTLLEHHFENTSGEVQARVADSIRLTTLSTLAYTAFNLSEPVKNVDPLDFECTFNDLQTTA